MSTEKDVYETMLRLLSKHGSPIPKRDLKSLLRWVSRIFPDTTPSIFTLCYWDKVGVKLYDLATLPGNEPELHLLPAWRAVIDAIKKEGGSEVTCEATAETVPAAVLKPDQPRSHSSSPVRTPSPTNLLRAIFTTHLVTPHDVKFLANLLLTPTQYAIFIAQWKKRLENLILTYAEHANQALAALTTDQLAGERAHTDPNAQAALPREALEGVTEAARYAFLKVPDAKAPQQSFINIKQAPQEPYMQFVDRLKQTLEKQIDNDQAKEVILLKLAVENANEDYKRLLKTLPPEPEPTLLQMIEACNRLGTLHYTTAVTSQAVGQGIAEAFAALKILPKKQSVCFGCEEPRHIKKTPKTAEKCKRQNHRVYALAARRVLTLLIPVVLNFTKMASLCKKTRLAAQDGDA
ncbi:hypothetical protein HGM15179_020439 [Zosterops borbonicus]|uniref:Retroviral nucleocapsid Gag protein p24 C-terminal domain-containing protein n=1 Tax=Zosterops borbonicus TaxID=364589 RepID=A0A8K1FU60_9PASS|nr:hypothetical protein HGM15179_020439 [Zosterops borbonicus]